MHACVHGGYSESPAFQAFGQQSYEAYDRFWFFFLVLGLTWVYFYVSLTLSALVLEVVPNFTAKVWKLVCSISQPLLRLWAFVF